ncbi:DUF881 domain-containing protein [Acidipropionibacterium virtanenii]|uniref:Uncharacterized protein n=1 Tax=Acidipropionibacterium virtanenii TaxID=2057246 RepID=A0A344UUG4_9ACTN|nr:DUF881 domain-containing protein [Acidipropionibacterium virtanenii]AXE38912.1 hypothetical protein JS278_01749 [Acidipropionibacterium virtanenii]
MTAGAGDQAGPGHTPRARPDASMDLLRQIREEAMEPEYLTATDRRGSHTPAGRGIIGTVLILVLAGIMLGGAWRATSTDRPATTQEREDLINRIESAGAHQSTQQSRVNQVRRQVSAMRSSAAAGQALSARVREAERATGITPVAGQGIEVRLDDSADGSEDGRIVDKDLRMLVNGLWQAGAEAVSVNGHRVTTTTSIRGAGSAITVDYASITRPYRVLALGDSRSLPADLSQNSGGEWMSYLQNNFSVAYSVVPRASVRLPGGDRSTVTAATPR